MDSKNIYILSERAKPFINWPLISDREWEYFGSHNDTDKEKVHSIIDVYFEEHDFYITRHRNNSIECGKSNLNNEIDSLIGTADFIIWNKAFTKAIEFSKIGVLRRGKSSL